MTRDRAGERGHARCAGDNGHAGVTCRFVKSADAGHEIASIGEIEIRHARVRASEGDALTAVLERTRGVDQQIRSMFGQEPADVAVAIRSHGSGTVQRGAKGACLPGATAGDKDVVAAIGQAPRQPRTETAIAAEDQDSAQSTRLACSAVGTQHVSRRPNNR